MPYSHQRQRAEASDLEAAFKLIVGAMPETERRVAKLNGPAETAARDVLNMLDDAMAALSGYAKVLRSLS